MENEIVNTYPSYSDYRNLLSKEDWDEYFQDKQFYYDDPLKLALLRSNQRLVEALKNLERKNEEEKLG